MPVRLLLVPAGLILARLLLAAAAAFAASGETPAVPEPLQEFKEGQIWESRSRQVVTLEELTAEMASRRVIYLGEEHHNHSHVESALTVLRALLGQGRRPILALEMFGWDGQAGLDRYLAGQHGTTERFLEDARWEQNWGGAFADYEPLLAFARTHSLPLLALNPPRPLVRLVAKQGLHTSLEDPAMAEWGMKDEHYPEDAPYQEMITGPLRQCHGGLSGQDYQRMYEASLFRDEGMAKMIVDTLRRTGSDGLIVSYTGGGHIQYQLPVPNRVRRRAGTAMQMTIYLTAFEPGRTEEIRALLTDKIADYVWLTSFSANGAPRRCPS
jgi:uncharacterized iron-regulated protein